MDRREGRPVRGGAGVKGREFAKLMAGGGLAPAAIADVCGVTTHEVAGWMRDTAPPWAVAAVVLARAVGLERVDPSQIAKARAVCEGDAPY